MSRTPCRKIDFHTHYLPKKLPDWRTEFGYGDFITLEKTESGSTRMMKNGVFFREVVQNLFDLEARLSDMDRDGIDVQVMCTVPVMFSYWARPEDGLKVSQFLNDDLHKSIQSYPKRFIGLGTVPMQDAALAAKELRRCVLELGLPGVQIGSHINDKNLDHESFNPFWEAAQECGGVVFIHPWDMEMGGRHKKFWLPWLAGMPYETCHAVMCVLMGGVLDRFPRLKVCFAHGGGAFPFTLGRIEHGYNCRPDLCATDCDKSPKSFLGRFCTDSIVHDAGATDYLGKIIGLDKIVFGTDYPFPLGEVTGSAEGIYPGHALDHSTINPDGKEKIYATNALRLLGLESKMFWD